MNRKPRPRRARYAKRQKIREEKKFVSSLQSLVNGPVGQAVAERHKGELMNHSTLQAIRRETLEGLRALGHDLSLIDIYPKTRGNQLQLIVGPRAPVMVGREDDPQSTGERPSR